VSVDLLLLVGGGILTLLGAGLVLLLSPPRYPTFIASVALAGLGLLQLGLARAVYTGPEAGSGNWFHLTLALSISVAVAWTLLCRTLGMGPEPAPLGIWKFYIVGQALAALAGLVWVVFAAAPQEMAVVAGRMGYPLGDVGRVVAAGALLHLVLTTASFESTYLALRPSDRRAFLPALVGILMANGYFTYVCAASLASGFVAVADLGLGAVPVAALSFLIAFSLIRGRIAEVRVRREKRPLTRTMSLTTSVGFLVTMAAILWLTRVTGWSLARGLWVLAGVGAALGIAALAISNRIQRRVQRILEGFLYRRAIDGRTLSTRVEQAVHSARTRAELCAIIPENAREIAGADPVTLFLAEDDSARFVAVSGTIPSLPRLEVRHDDPLASELRRVQRAIPLRGRRDDLEYIPIYVENASQIHACQATCAAPIMREDELLGFLLCGAPHRKRERGGRILAVLDLVCPTYAARLESFTYPAGRGILSE
jgi:hypothetical protein